MRSKSDHIEVVTYDNENEVVKEVFELLYSGYQIGLETSIKSSDFIIDSGSFRH